ncbi:MAG: maleylpyruvate isomerase family mycothiol-dependent enzyme [Frankiales bacterium]|nr:maleylpyruvate isomerase family mycothiol-dependent enzyme [Frankiales bacterium]
MGTLSRIAGRAGDPLCHDRRVLDRDAYLTSLERDSAAFADLLAEADLAAPVPHCPGWTVTDLALHLSGVHRWARTAVVTAAPGEEPVGPSDRDGLVAWCRAGSAELLETLRTTDPSTPVWHFGPKPRVASFWVRRQAHETAVHLGDLRRAAGRDAPMDPELAADGVDEVVTVFFPRQVRLGRTPPVELAVAVTLTDTGGSWVVSGDGLTPGSDPVAGVEGSAYDVLHALWHRADADALRIVGDEAAARAVLAAALAP